MASKIMYFTIFVIVCAVVIAAEMTDMTSEKPTTKTTPKPTTKTTEKPTTSTKKPTTPPTTQKPTTTKRPQTMLPTTEKMVTTEKPMVPSTMHTAGHPSTEIPSTMHTAEHPSTEMPGTMQTAQPNTTEHPTTMETVKPPQTKKCYFCVKCGDKSSEWTQKICPESWECTKYIKDNSWYRGCAPNCSVETNFTSPCYECAGELCNSGNLMKSYFFFGLLLFLGLKFLS